MRKEMTIVAVAALGGLLAASSTSQAKTVGYTFTEINVPGSQPGSTGQNGLGMNNLGQVTGTYNDSSGAHNFLYTNGKYVALPGAPGAFETHIVGINDWGQMLGIAYYSNGSDNFIDTHGKFTVLPNTHFSNIHKRQSGSPWLWRLSFGRLWLWRPRAERRFHPD